MKTVDFNAQVTDSGQISIPPEIAAQVPRGEPIQVVLQWGAPEEDALWREAGRRRFEAAYAEDDSIYEALIDDAPTR